MSFQVLTNGKDASVLHDGVSLSACRSSHLGSTLEKTPAGLLLGQGRPGARHRGIARISGKSPATASSARAREQPLVPAYYARLAQGSKSRGVRFSSSCRPLPATASKVWHFFKVEDIQAAAERIRELGGEAEFNEHYGPGPSGHSLSAATTRVRGSACTCRPLISARAWPGLRT